MAETCLLHSENRGIHHLVMNHGANALDHELITALRETIQKLRDDGAPPILLGSAHEAIFSPGWNMKQLGSSKKKELAAFLDHFNGLIFDLFSYPGPTAAAINGHSVAGGCLLAMTCDLRVMATGRARIGLAELNLGVPIPASSVRMLSARLSPSVIDELAFGGDGFVAEEALTHGIVHRTASPQGLQKLVEQTLHTIASKPRAAYTHSKRFLCAKVWQEMQSIDKVENQVFVDCWFSPETQERIATVFKELSS